MGENYTLRSLIKTSFFYCNQQLNSEWVKFQNEMGLSDESKKEIVSLNKIHAECPHCKSLFDIDPPSGTFIHPSPPVPPIESGERGEVERLKGLLKEQFCAVVLACMSGVGMEAKDELLESQWEIYKMENNV